MVDLRSKTLHIWNPKKILIQKGVDRYLDAEAIRVIKSMPPFTPGKQLGRAVKVQYSTRIVFSLE